MILNTHMYKHTLHEESMEGYNVVGVDALKSYA